MNFEEILKNVGLNDVESKVYLASLELGPSTVLPISKKSGVKRTYCYDVLADLMRRGLVSYYEKNNRRRYTASDPKRLKDRLQDRLNRFDEALPELRSIYNTSDNKPAIRFFEGREEVSNIYEMLPRSKRIDVMGSPDHIYMCIGNKFNEMAKMVGKKKRALREIVPEKNIGAPYLHELDESQEVRTLPGLDNLATDLIILDDRVALISFEKEIMGVVIESSEVVSLQRYMFDFVWCSAKGGENGDT